MNLHFSQILLFLKQLLILSFSQFLGLLSVFFFFGILLYLFARLTRTTFVKSIGQNFDIYVTGWIGTPVHELGHALFCIPFFHKITEIKLFTPKSGNGSLGHVNHSYNAGNLWQAIGNFFIGFGPILFGSVVIYLLMKYLLPNYDQLIHITQTQAIGFTDFNSIKLQFIELCQNSGQGLKLLFTTSNFHNWQFYVFLYVAMSVSSHMELSPLDLKGVAAGLISIAVLLLLVNTFGLLFHINVTTYISKLSGYIQALAGIFIWALMLSAIFFITSYIVLNVYTLIRFHKLFHPFG